MVVLEKAPAKINLALDVLSKRDDGYHEVEMVMTTVDLADRLQLTNIDEDKIVIYSQALGVPADERNLSYKAALLMKERYDIKKGVRIQLDKNIPASAGLAGGSSDAAATLRGLNKLWDLQLSYDELKELATVLGSDVTYCIRGGTALATGRGEVVHQLPAAPNAWVVLARPQIGVATADVYANLKLDGLVRPDIQAMLQALDNHDYHSICTNAGNVLESVTLKWIPQIAHIKEYMLGAGADVALMSGSGATVFAIVGQETRARRIYNGLRGFCKDVFVVRVLGECHD